MTTVQHRPAGVRRPGIGPLVPAPRREPAAPTPAAPRRARTVAITELMGRRPDLHDVYTPATIAADAVLWSA
jgi:hypothetical protein